MRGILLIVDAELTPQLQRGEQALRRAGSPVDDSATLSEMFWAFAGVLSRGARKEISAGRRRPRAGDSPRTGSAAVAGRQVEDPGRATVTAHPIRIARDVRFDGSGIERAATTGAIKLGPTEAFREQIAHAPAFYI